MVNTTGPAAQGREYSDGGWGGTDDETEREDLQLALEQRRVAGLAFSLADAG